MWLVSMYLYTVILFSNMLRIARSYSKQQYDRGVEYGVRRMKSAFGTDQGKASVELKCWEKIQGKGMLDLRKKFVSEFTQKGFGFVEGSKFKSYVQEEIVRKKTRYLTAEQILDEEKGSKANMKAKIDNAKQLGEGTSEPGKHKGWYKDPSRGGAAIYMYGDPLEHIEEFKNRRGWETTQTTGKISIKDGKAAPPGGSPLAIEDVPVNAEDGKGSASETEDDSSSSSGTDEEGEESGEDTENEEIDETRVLDAMDALSEDLNLFDVLVGFKSKIKKLAAQFQAKKDPRVLKTLSQLVRGTAKVRTATTTTTIINGTTTTTTTTTTSATITTTTTTTLLLRHTYIRTSITNSSNINKSQ